MSQPVKLSDALVLDARLTAEPMERSIAGQVEFWARLGRSVDQLLDGRQALEASRLAAARPVVDCLRSVDSPEGRRRLADVLDKGPFPRYAAHPERPGWLVRTKADGTRTVGRFVNREFRSAGRAAKKR